VPRFIIVAISTLTVVTIAAPLVAQTGGGQITGLVSDSLTGQPVGAVEVIVVGTRLRARTAEDGRYTLVGVPSGDHVVEAKRLGYVLGRKRVEVATDATVNVDFRLAVVAFRLQEVVVTGVAGETEGTKLAFTVGRIDADRTPVPPPNALEAIQGKIAGATVVPASGQPGSSASVQLRTPTSISKSNDPLIAVDGVILGTTGGTAADLNSLDIERVEVLKGAAAASLYGSRAQAGVMQIWTRRGNQLDEGRTQVTLRSEVGFNSLPRKVSWAQYHSYLMNAAQTSYVNAAARDTNRVGRVEEPTTSGGFGFQDNPYPVGATVYDQVDAFFDPGTYYTNTITIAQNSGATNWFGSASQHRSEGVIDDNGSYRRYDVRLNLDHRIRSDLSIGLSGYYARSVRDELDENTFFDLINIAPDVNLREPDPDGTPFAFQPDNDPRSAIRANPLYKNATEQDWTARGRFLGSVTVRYNPLGWLGFDGNVSYDRSDRYRSSFLDRGLKSDQYQTGGPGFITQQNEFADALNASASITLAHQVGATSIRTVFRGLMEREDNTDVTASGEQLSVVGLPDLENAQVRSVNSAVIGIRANSFFGITSVEHAGKYIVDGLVRRDGSSLFGPGERWHTYNRMSAAYRMAQEPWWPFDRVTEFKLRFSRGTAGGRPTFADQFETYEIGSGGTLTKETLGNPLLKPERSTESEYGLDVLAFDRLSVQLTYARNTIRDELILIPQLAGVGFESRWENAGTLTGNTFEATLEARLISRAGLTWRAGLVFDRSRHRITEFDRACFRIGVAYRCAGEPLGVMYGNHFLRDLSELTFLPDSLHSQFAVNDDGLVVWVGPGNSYTDGVANSLWGTTVTLNGSPYGWGLPVRQPDASGSPLNPALVRIGNSTPNFNIGLSSELTWRNLILYGLVAMQVGGEAFNATKMRQYQWYRSGDEDQAGKPEERKKPPAYYAALYNGNEESDWFVEPGGFLKLRELSMRYRLPVSRVRQLRSLGIRGISLALVGRNLFTITNYSGYDPEVRDEETEVQGGNNPVARVDDFDYPRFRTLTATVQIEF
jgi:TonB-linked SusC/RagA family outer membrane protein